MKLSITLIFTACIKYVKHSIRKDLKAFQERCKAEGHWWQLSDWSVPLLQVVFPSCFSMPTYGPSLASGPATWAQISSPSSGPGVCVSMPLTFAPHTIPLQQIPSPHPSPSLLKRLHQSPCTECSLRLSLSLLPSLSFFKLLLNGKCRLSCSLPSVLLGAGIPLG